MKTSLIIVYCKYLEHVVYDSFVVDHFVVFEEVIANISCNRAEDYHLRANRDGCQRLAYSRRYKLDYSARHYYLYALEVRFA